METLRGLKLKDLRALARHLGKKFSGKGTVLGLTGNLGSGKTTFTKSFAKALGVAKVKSPSFIVAAKYKIHNGSFYHLDFYRLNRLDELAHLGLEEILSNNSNVVVIEWADKFKPVLNKCDLIINFRVRPGNLRDVSIKHN